MILFHVGVPAVSGGFVGVDVFFVISGFLITGFIVAARESDEPASLTDFYARRVRRLLPAGLVVLIACAIANLALAPDQRHASFTAAAMAAAGYASNLQFIAESFSYFDAEVARNPVLHTWIGAACDKGLFGWPCDAKIEELRNAFGMAQTEEERKKIATELQARAMEQVVYIPFGQWDTPLAYRADKIDGIVPNTGLAVLWGITKK